MNNHQKQFTVGNRTFTMITLQPLAATQYAFRIKKIMESGLNNGMDSGVVNILSQLDEKTLDNLIFPLLRDSAVVCTSSERRVISGADMNEEYTLEDMDEFFLMVWEVLKANLGPFFKKLVKNLFGYDLENLDVKALTEKLKGLAAEAQKPKSVK